MGQILIRNLDDAVIARLKLRAATHNVSMEEEARRAITASVDGDWKSWLARADAVRQRVGRLSGPSSTELLREDRDRDETR